MKLAAVADELAAAVATLARHRIGAVILWNPAIAIEGGVILEAKVSRQLLVALCIPEHVNRLHGGAVVIHGDRIARAAVPISWADVVGRAVELAAGVAIAVDGNTGEIKIADRTGYVAVVDADELADVLRRHTLEACPR